MIVALCGVILIILTASILCLTGRNRRAQARARARTHQKYGYGKYPTVALCAEPREVSGVVLKLQLLKLEELLEITKKSSKKIEKSISISEKYEL